MSKMSRRMPAMSRRLSRMPCRMSGMSRRMLRMSHRMSRMSCRMSGISRRMSGMSRRMLRMSRLMSGMSRRMSIQHKYKYNLTLITSCLILSVPLYINENLNVSFVVKNAGSQDEDVKVTIQDDKHFAISPQSRTFHLKAWSNQISYFTVHGGQTKGETT